MSLEQISPLPAEDWGEWWQQQEARRTDIRVCQHTRAQPPRYVRGVLAHTGMPMHNHMCTHTSAAARVHNHTDVPSHMCTRTPPQGDSAGRAAHNRQRGGPQSQAGSSTAAAPTLPPGTRPQVWAGGGRGTHREVM